MPIYKTLSFALVALLFGACVASSATPNATHFKSMDMSRSALGAGDFPGRSINPADAKHHIGKRMTVCGVAASASYAARSSSRPTFLNLDEPYPRRIFTVMIWGEGREKFGTPETSLMEKRVCVSGLIEEYQSVPRIVLRKASQLVEEVD